MKKVVQPFKAPRNRMEPSSPNVQASPTRRSPGRQGKLDKDLANSEGPTELVCTRWVIKETQETDIIQSDNDSGAKTGRDEFDGNAERRSFKARFYRSPGVHSSQDPFTTTAASPDISEFERYLENGEFCITLPSGRRKKLSKNDEFWEGHLASEKLRLQQLSDLTPLDAMMVGSTSDEENTGTPLKSAAKTRIKDNSTRRRAKAKLTSTNEPDGASSGLKHLSCIQ